jgi:Tfp pilus assembly protein PilF
MSFGRPCGTKNWRPHVSKLKCARARLNFGSGWEIGSFAAFSLKSAVVSAKPFAMRRQGFIYLLLALVTLGLFLPVVGHDFLNYDDQGYVTENVRVQAGLTRAGLVWAFRTGADSNWHPLTWLSHMLDCQLYGLKPAGHHLTSLLFHIANTLLLYGVLRRMTGAMWRSAMVAALFAWHPMHVESVAWVAERKDVLSAFFWLLTMLAYARYVEKPAATRYLLCLLFFVLGLLSKPMLVTLPFVLLLLDFWPLGRMAVPRVKTLAASKGDLVSSRALPLKRLILEKAPFFILTAASCVVTYLVQARSGAVASLSLVPFGLRLANLPIAYCSYLLKLLWPENLCILYPLPESWPGWEVAAATMLILAVSGAVVVFAQRQRALFTGWFWFLGTLVPVIGLVQVGSQAIADRYTYIPSIGFFILLVWGGAAWAANGKRRRKICGAAAGAALLACCVCTGRQLQYWKNSVTVFDHAVKATQNNVLAYLDLGDALVAEGKFQDGLDKLYEAARLQPKYALAQGKLGAAMSRQGKTTEAIAYYRRALELNPDLPEALNNLAWILAANNDAALRNGPEAVQLAEQACRVTHYEIPLMIGTLADAYAEAGRFKEAAETAEKARQLALSAGETKVAAKNEELLLLYRDGRAYHEERH